MNNELDTVILAIVRPCQLKSFPARMTRTSASLLDTYSLFMIIIESHGHDFQFLLCHFHLDSNLTPSLFLLSPSQRNSMSVIVNTCVCLLPQKKTLLPWTISRVSESEYTFLDFFKSDICPKLPGNSSSDPGKLYELLSSHVGPSKDSLDPVDLSLPIYPVIDSFGRYLKYCVNINAEFESTCTSVTNRSAFEVLTSSSNQETTSTIQESQCTLELIQIVERNKKNKLHNDIVQVLASKGLSFLNQDEVKSSGMKLVCLLCEIFWYIDGHHHAFQSRSVSVPKDFECFLNYNVPQLSKHRRRRTINMSADSLNDFTLELDVILHENYWNRESWCDFKPVLLESLSGYVSYLTSKNKA